MSVIASVASALFWGVLLLSVLVFVHEAGHYLAARALGVRVTEFFLGLPCRWRVYRKSPKVGTEIGVTPLLLGGYTRISGMENSDDELLGDAAALVMERGRAGASEVAEALGCSEDHALDLLATLADWATVRVCDDDPAAVETVARDANLLTEYDRGHDFSLPGSTAAGEPHPLEMTPAEFASAERSRTYLGTGFFGRCAMLVAGPLVNVLAAFLIFVCALMVRGVDYVPNVSTLGSVTEGSLAASAGLEAGDTVTSVGGVPVSTWEELVSAVEPYLQDGVDMELTYERDGRETTVVVDVPEGYDGGLLGINSMLLTYHPTFGEAASSALSYVGTVASYVARLVMPQHTMEVLEQSSSVVGIAAAASDAAAQGPFDFAMLAVAISLSLGFMNLLPIPPLDGGKILVEVVQLVIRRPLPAKVSNGLSYAGLVLLLLVFVIVLKNDVARILIG